MNVVLFGNNASTIQDLLEKKGFNIVKENPDFVVSFGGDGTVMKAEGAYPGIPKIVLRNSLICKKCSPLTNEEVLNKIISNDYIIEELIKLEAVVKKKVLIGFNEVMVHNRDPRSGIRYSLIINGKKIEKEIIGDGIVVATPYGSTGYYRSITDSFTEVGIGVAFNNSTEQADHMVLKDDSIIELHVSRGPAEVYADNHHECVEINDGDEVLIRKSSETAKIVIPGK
jgi:NAD+ kinase